eukprot:6485345-Alexandrium_andersonii.AAC.1
MHPGVALHPCPVGAFACLLAAHLRTVPAGGASAFAQLRAEPHLCSIRAFRAVTHSGPVPARSVSRGLDERPR